MAIKVGCKKLFLRKGERADLEGDIKKLIEKEAKYLCNPQYVEDLQCKAGINPSFRSKLAYWTFAFETEFHVGKETLLLAMNLVDRFLSLRLLRKEYLQLLAIAAVFVATKILETKPFQVHGLAILAEGIYTADDILKFERLLLVTLDFRIHCVTSLEFFNLFLDLYYTKYNNSSIHQSECERFGRDLLQTTYFSYSFVKYRPSEKALGVLSILNDYFNDFDIFFKEVIQLINIDSIERIESLKKDILTVYNYNFGDKENALPTN